MLESTVLDTENYAYPPDSKEPCNNATQVNGDEILGESRAVEFVETKELK